MLSNRERRGVKKDGGNERKRKRTEKRRRKVDKIGKRREKS